jgi:hypothetical protein
MALLDVRGRPGRAGPGLRAGADARRSVPAVRAEGIQAPVGTLSRKPRTWGDPPILPDHPDVEADDDRHGALGAEVPGEPCDVVVGVDMLPVTRGGSEYPASQCQRWLATAGFVDVQRRPLGGADTLVTGRKPA